MTAVTPDAWHQDYIPTLEDWQSAFNNANFNSAKAYIDGILGTISALGWANLSDYYGADKTDAALAMRNAIASGKKVIFVPPGSYVCKSALTTYGSATNPSCFEIRGQSDVWILAYGATFTVASPILINGTSSTSTPTTVLSITSDSKHCGILGGRFDGNLTGLSSGAENVAINLASVTNITVRDTKISGSFLAAISGVFIFDSLIENVQSFKNALGFDIAHVENLTIRGCRFEADTSNPVGGINQHYDVPTLGDNNSTTETGSGRTLTDGKANRLRVLDNTFVGFANSVALEGMNHAVVARNTIRGIVANTGSPQCGVLLYCGTTATTAGQTSSDTLVVDNEITGCGNLGSGGGGGVFLGHGVALVAFRGNRIYDNLGYGVNAQDTSLTGISSLGDDWKSRSGGTTQTAPWPVSLDGIIAAALGQGATDAALTVTHGLGVQFGKPWSSTVASGAVAFLPNNSNLSWYDSGAAAQPILGVSSLNETFVRAAADATYVTLQSHAGASLLKAGVDIVQVQAGTFQTDPGTAVGVRGALTVLGVATLGGKLNITAIPTYASNAAAIAGGLAAGDAYLCSATSPPYLTLRQ